LVESVFDPSKMIKSQAQTDELLRKTGMSLIQIGTNAEEAGKKFKEAGGKIDATGQILITAKERVFDLGQGISRSSDVYIAWAENYIRQGKDVAFILDWLTKSGIKTADAQKIYNFALADSKKPLADTKKGTEDLTKAQEDLTKAYEKRVAANQEMLD